MDISTLSPRRFRPASAVGLRRKCLKGLNGFFLEEICSPALRAGQSRCWELVPDGAIRFPDISWVLTARFIFVHAWQSRNPQEMFSGNLGAPSGISLLHQFLGDFLSFGARGHPHQPRVHPHGCGCRRQGCTLVAGGPGFIPGGVSLLQIPTTFHACRRSLGTYLPTFQ